MDVPISGEGGSGRIEKFHQVPKLKALAFVIFLLVWFLIGGGNIRTMMIKAYVLQSKFS